MTPKPIKPKTGQESVWDYPRPPSVEPRPERVVVRFGGQVIADTTVAVRVLETSHPPTYYLPIDAFPDGVLVPVEGTSFANSRGKRTTSMWLPGEWSHPVPDGPTRSPPAGFSRWPRASHSTRAGWIPARSMANWCVRNPVISTAGGSRLRSSARSRANPERRAGEPRSAASPYTPSISSVDSGRRRAVWLIRGRAILHKESYGVRQSLEFLVLKDGRRARG